MHDTRAQEALRFHQFTALTKMPRTDPEPNPEAIAKQLANHYLEARKKVSMGTSNKAMLYSEARTYRLDNQYLDDRQRVDVEMWFIAPIELFYALTAFMMLICQPVMLAVLTSAAVSVTYMEFFFWRASSRLFYPFHRAILRATKSHFLTFGLLVASVFISSNPWWLALLIILAYYLNPFQPSVVASVVLHGSKMHPKYMFAKRRYSLLYPWDGSPRV